MRFRVFRRPPCLTRRFMPPCLHTPSSMRSPPPGGRSIDTTMGLTPLEGLVMATRCGDLDPAIVLYLQRQQGLSVDQLDHALNYESGLLGLSGVSGDMKTLLEQTHASAVQMAI